MIQGAGRSGLNFEGNREPRPPRMQRLIAEASLATCSTWGILKMHSNEGDPIWGFREPGE